MGAEEPHQRQRGRDLRAVDEGDPFLRLEDDGGEAGPRQRLGGGQTLAGVEGLALAHHRRRHVRERREVAGGADRALFRDDGNDALLQHRLDQADDLHTCTGRAAAERQELQDHDEADDANVEWRADAARMRQDQIALQRLDVVRRYAHARKLAEAGIDPVDRLVAAGDGRDARRRRLDARMRRRVEAHRHLVAPDPFELGERDRTGRESENHCRNTPPEYAPSPEALAIRP
jgi:hypothetical protein